MSDTDNKENSHDISIALISKDIAYIRDSLKNVETTIALYDRNFARKDETGRLEKLIVDNEKTIQRNLEEFQREMRRNVKSMEDNFNKNLELKVDNKDFVPIKTTLSRINWIMVSGVVIALLSLIIQTGK